MKYYVKGGPESNGKHGFILSVTNWDPIHLGIASIFHDRAVEYGDRRNAASGALQQPFLHGRHGRSFQEQEADTAAGQAGAGPVGVLTPGKRRGLATHSRPD